MDDANYLSEWIESVLAVSTSDLGLRYATRDAAWSEVERLRTPLAGDGDRQRAVGQAGADLLRRLHARSGCRGRG